MIDYGTLDLTAIWAGTTENVVGSDELAQLFAGPDDDSCTYFYQLNSSFSTYYSVLYCYVVDASGDFTSYRSAAFPSGGSGYIESIAAFGRTSFLVTMGNGTTFWVRVANQKLNNSSPILISPSSYPITNPCYNVVNNVFYDASNGLLAAGFYESVGQEGTAIYASIYRINPYDGSLILKSSGYVANVLAGQADPFNKTSLSFNARGGYGPFLQQQSNGLSGGYFGVLDSVSGETYEYQCRAIYNVNPGISTNCNTPCGATVTSSGKTIFSTGLYSTQTAPMCDISIPRLTISGWNLAPGNSFIMLGDNFSGKFSLNYDPLVGNNSPAACAVTAKHIFTFLQYGAPKNNDAIGIVANPGIKNGSLLHRRAYFTTNNTRPVSPTGRFIT